MNLLKRLHKYVGFRIIVDYKTSEKILYAKGTLLDIIDDRMVVVKGEDKEWYIEISSIVAMRIEGTEGDTDKNVH